MANGAASGRKLAAQQQPQAASDTATEDLSGGVRFPDVVLVGKGEIIASDRGVARQAQEISHEALLRPVSDGDRSSAEPVFVLPHDRQRLVS